MQVENTDSQASSCASVADTPLLPDCEESTWRRFYATANQATVAAVLVKHLSDQESAFTHRALFLAACVTLERDRRRARISAALLDVLTAPLRLLASAGDVLTNLVRRRQQEREMSALLADEVSAAGSGQESGRTPIDLDRKAA